MVEAGQQERMMRRTNDGATTNNNKTTNKILMVLIVILLYIFFTMETPSSPSSHKDGTTEHNGGDAMKEKENSAEKLGKQFLPPQTVPPQATPPPTPAPIEYDDHDKKGYGTFTGYETFEECEYKLPFSRKYIEVCEGYYRQQKKPLINRRTGKPIDDPLSFPVRSRAPFCGQHNWEFRLNKIEQRALESEGETEQTESGIIVSSFRGLSTSRLDGTMLGNKEFTDYTHLTHNYIEDDDTREAANDEILDDDEYATRRQLHHGQTVCWTGDYREHYLNSYNIMPSKEFYDYVNKKYLQAIKDTSRDRIQNAADNPNEY